MFFKRNIGPATMKYGNAMLMTMVGIDKRTLTLRQMMDAPKEIPVVETRKATDQEILLGCADDDYQVPITIPYNGKSFGMLVVAGKGDGKTQFIKHLALSQLHMRFGYNILFLDPKNDYQHLALPLKEAELIRRLENHGLQARGFAAKYYKPVYLNMTDRDAQEYILTLKGFDAFEYGKRDSAIKELFSIDERSPAGKALGWILSKRIPKTIAGLKNMLKEYRVFLKKSREEAGSKNSNVSVAFDIELERLIKQGLIGDDGQELIMEVDDNGRPTKTKKVYAAHFPEDIEKHRILVLEVDLSAEKSRISSCYLKITLATMWQDRKTYVDTKGQKGVMSNPTVFVLDEADTYCPNEKQRDSPSREQINEFMRRGRQFGWGVVAITQQPQQISNELKMHCDYLVTTRLRNPKLIELVQDKYGLEKHEVEELKNLDYDLTSPIKKWVCFTGNPAKKYVTFYPFPPPCAMKVENQ